MHRAERDPGTSRGVVEARTAGDGIATRGAEAVGARRPCAYPNLGTIIAVSSGKGGVGKSTVATNLAVALAAQGARVGLMDADIYGPNVPRMMGVDEPPSVIDEKIIPLRRTA